MKLNFVTKIINYVRSTINIKLSMCMSVCVLKNEKLNYIN